MSSIQLTPEELKLLKEISDSGPELMRHRAQLILAYAQGMQTLAAAGKAGMSRGRGRYWKREFFRRGIDIFGGKYLPKEKSDNHNIDNHLIIHLVEASEPQEVISNQVITTSKKDKSKIGKKALAVDIPVLPFPERVEKPGILPDDSLGEAGRKIFRAQFAEMLAHEEGTRLGEDIERLHDMRVATRRMRAAVAVFGDSFEKKKIRRYLEGLRQTGRALGNVRDLDVFMEKARHYLFGLPSDEQSGLNPLLENWENQLFAAREQLINHLNSQAYQEFKLAYNYFVQTPGLGIKEFPNFPPQPHRVREVVPCLVYNRLAAVRAYGPLVNLATIPQLHALRIEFKQLRYTLEFFNEVLGTESRQVINLIKMLQDHLGDLHDAEVACQILSAFLHSWDENQLGLTLAARQNPEPIVNYLAYQHAERHRLLVSFPEEWVKFETTEVMIAIAKAIAAL